jgi:hypothetical protein
MKQRSILLDLASKGGQTLAFHQDIVSTLGSETAASIGDVMFASSKPALRSPEQERQLAGLDPAIFRGLADQPFASIR